MNNQSREFVVWPFNMITPQDIKLFWVCTAWWCKWIFEISQRAHVVGAWKNENLLEDSVFRTVRSHKFQHTVTTLCACHGRLPGIGPIWRRQASHGWGKKCSGWNRTYRTGGYGPVKGQCTVQVRVGLGLGTGNGLYSFLSALKSNVHSCLALLA